MPDSMPPLEVYREKFEITEWRDGCVYNTRTLGCGWFDADEVQANRPGSTGVTYVAASDTFAKNNMTIRKKKET
jgi:hypothetical protein